MLRLLDGANDALPRPFRGPMRFGLLPATPPAPANPLSPYYGVGPGRIAIHHSTAGAVPAGGPATSLTNLGGSGAYHNASAVGGALGVEGNYLRFTATGGIMTLLNPAELSDVHLMFVLDGAAISNGRKLFGSPTTEILISATATHWRLATRRGVGSTPVTLTGTLVPIAPGPHLCEVTTSPTDGTTQYINGVLNKTDANAALTSYPLVDLGRGSDMNLQLDGLMGDVLGVTLGAGSDAAITAAMAYLSARFGRTWAR